MLLTLALKSMPLMKLEPRAQFGSETDWVKLGIQSRTKRLVGTGIQRQIKGSQCGKRALCVKALDQLPGTRHTRHRQKRPPGMGWVRMNQDRGANDCGPKVSTRHLPGCAEQPRSQTATSGWRVSPGPRCDRLTPLTSQLYHQPPQG